MPNPETTPFTPALGRSELTSQYDRVIAVMTRERKWRALLLSALVPRDGEVIVDLGAGTGSMAILVKQASPGARVVAVDPDPEVQAVARAKVTSVGVEIEFVTALGDAPVLPDGTVDKVISSLVLHQCPAAAKTGILANAYRLLRPSGRLLIADYGLQRTLLMDLLFRQVRTLDGFENTRANKNGEIPAMISAAGFERVEELSVTQTPTGSISLYSAFKPNPL